MRRRDFITALAGATAWMSAAHAQKPQHVIGFLSAFESSNAMPGTLASFYQGLRETGFVEGRNISIEFRWAEATLQAEERARDLAILNLNIDSKLCGCQVISLKGRRCSPAWRDRRSRHGPREQNQTSLSLE